MPGGQFQRRPAVSFAATASGRRADAMGEEPLSKARVFIRRGGCQPRDAMTTPERLALAVCET